MESAAELGVSTIDRCNLTVLLEPGQEDLVDFLVKHKVRVVASLPCYSAKNVDQQRGNGVFDRSIRGLQASDPHKHIVYLKMEALICLPCILS